MKFPLRRKTLAPPVDLQAAPPVLREAARDRVVQARRAWERTFPQHAAPDENQDELGGRIGRLPPEVQAAPATQALVGAMWEAFTLDQVIAGFSEDVPVNLFRTQRTCGCADLDRKCLQCGKQFCALCAPGVGGGPCPECHGPVYQDREERPPGLVNPEMGTH
jgi:hypothetical protein